MGPSQSKPLTPQELEELKAKLRMSLGFGAPEPPSASSAPTSALIDLSAQGKLPDQPAVNAVAEPVSQGPQKVETPGERHYREGWMPWLGAQGVRLGGGLLSAEGGVPGAAISGIAETLAQKIESPDAVDAGKIAIEAGLGAIPFGKIVKGIKPGISLAGQQMANALRMAGYVEAGNMARRAYDEGNPLPGGTKELAMDLATMGVGAKLANMHPRFDTFAGTRGKTVKSAIGDLAKAVEENNGAVVPTGRIAGRPELEEIIKRNSTVGSPELEGVVTEPRLVKRGGGTVAQSESRIAEPQIPTVTEPTGRTMGGPELISKMGETAPPTPAGLRVAGRTAKMTENPVAYSQNFRTYNAEAQRLPLKVQMALDVVDAEPSRVPREWLDSQGRPLTPEAEKSLAHEAMRKEVAKRKILDDYYMQTETKPAQQQAKAEQTADREFARSEVGGTNLKQIKEKEAKAAEAKRVADEKAQVKAEKEAKVKQAELDKAKRIEAATTLRDRLISENKLEEANSISGTSEKIPTETGTETVKTFYRKPAEEGTGVDLEPEGGGSTRGPAPVKPTAPPKLDPVQVASTSYTTEKAAQEALGRTGKAGVVKARGKKGNWVVVFDETEEPLSKAVTSTAEPTNIPNPENVAPGAKEIAGKLKTALKAKKGEVAPAVETLTELSPEAQNKLNTLANKLEQSLAKDKERAAGRVSKEPPTEEPPAATPVKPEPKPPAPPAPAAAEAPKPTPASADNPDMGGKYVVVGQTKDGKLQVYVGRDKDHLINEYNGLKNSGGHYIRIGTAKLPKGMTKSAMVDKVTQQFNGKGVEIYDRTTPTVGPKMGAEVPHKSPIEMRKAEVDAATREEVKNWTVDELNQMKAKYPKDKRLATIIDDELKSRLGNEPPPEPTAPAPAPVEPTPKEPKGGASAKLPDYVNKAAHKAETEVKGEVPPKVEKPAVEAPKAVPEAPKAEPKTAKGEKAAKTEKVIIGTGEAKNSNDVRALISAELEDYKAKWQKYEDSRGVDAKGNYTYSEKAPAPKTIEIPNGPTYTVKNGEQASNLIEKLNSTEGASAFKGIVAGEKVSNPPRKLTPSNSNTKPTVMTQADADKLGMTPDIVEHAEVVGPKAATKDFELKNTNKVRYVDSFDKLPNTAKHAILTTDKDGVSTLFISDNPNKLSQFVSEWKAKIKETQGKYAAKRAIKEGTLPAGKTWESYLKENNFDPEKSRLAVVGESETYKAKPAVPVVSKAKAVENVQTTAKEASNAVEAELNRANSVNQSAKDYLATKTPEEIEASKARVAAAREKVERGKAQTQKNEAAAPKAEGVPTTKDGKTKAELLQKHGLDPNMDMNDLVLEQQKAADDYFALREQFKQGGDKSIEAEMRAAGQKMGELKAATALAAKAEGKQVSAVVEPTVAKPKGKGPTSDDLAATPPEELEAKLKQIVDEFKGKKQLASEKGRLKGEKGAVINNLAIRAGLSVTGAVAGAAMTPNDPITGAIIGGAVGLGTPSVFRALAPHVNSLNGAARKASSEALGKEVHDFVTGALNLMPDYFRASYLAHPVNLPINAWVGPYGASMLGAIEHGLAGDPRGWKAAKLLLSKRVIKLWQPAWKEAETLVARAEERGDVTSTGKGLAHKIVTTPARAMTSGDIVGRKILMEAGFNELEARQLTLTSEPRSTLSGAIGSFRRYKGAGGSVSWAAKMMLPFYRTNANQAEQSILRTPLGNYYRNKWKMAPVSTKQLLVQSGISSVLAGGSFVAGMEMQDTNPMYVLPATKFITNAAGPYGTTAGIFFIAGTMYAKNKELGKSLLNSAQEYLKTGTPLPTVDVFMQWLEFAKGGLKGDFKPPYGAVPAPLSSKQQFSIPTAERYLAGDREFNRPTKNEYSVFVPMVDRPKLKPKPKTPYQLRQEAIKRKEQEVRTRER